MEESSASAETFKKPVLPVKEIQSNHTFKKPAAQLHGLISIGDLPKNADEKICDETEASDQRKVKKKERSQPNVPLPYEEPVWHGHPPYNYSLEIIKNGTFISNLPIRTSLVVFGRLDVCDVVFEHPSVSRYHAVIQYCSGDDTHPKGFYLYDLGSTHGTFLNKEKISSKVYYKLKVGYILKFGGSSRLHIFQGPEEDEEEIKPKQTEVVKDGVEQEVCSWGISDDAEEEEDLTDNPFALQSTNEDLYIDDPKKTLRGWFEREGYDLEYKCEEKGMRTFSCTVRLPVDNPTGEFLPVEASVSGKKKEAVIACALEACRTLDRLGLLRQSHQESKQRKRKKWEENDYYDSDEDTFYDRTGEIEKRREMRKRLTKKVEVNNFETISAKLTAIQAEIKEIKNKISESESRDSHNSSTKEADPLDMYMSNLSESGSSLSDKFERRKLKLKLIELEKEQTHLEKLSNIAKPVSLPPLKKNLGFVGKRPQSKLKLPPVPKIEVKEPPKSDEQIEEYEMDDEEPTVNELNFETKEVKQEISDVNDSVGLEKTDLTAKKENKSANKYGLILNPSRKTSDIGDKALSLDYSMELSNEDKESLKNQDEAKKEKETIDSEKKSENLQENIKKDKKQNKQEKSKKKDNSKSIVDVYKTETNDYCTWMPPSNQSGDGMTHLNAKFGY